MNSQSQRQSLINQTGKDRRARFNVLGLLAIRLRSSLTLSEVEVLALKFISRWECGLHDIGASY